MLQEITRDSCSFSEYVQRLPIVCKIQFCSNLQSAKAVIFFLHPSAVFLFSTAVVNVFLSLTWLIKTNVVFGRKMRDKILYSDNMTEEHNQRSVTSGVWTRFNFIRVVVGSFEHGSVATFGFHGRREFRES